MSLPQPTRPQALNPRDFPTWDAYQAARQRDLTRSRIINLRATNRHLSLKEIAYHTGVSVQYVEDALGDPT